MMDVTMMMYYCQQEVVSATLPVNKCYFYGLSVLLCEFAAFRESHPYPPWIKFCCCVLNAALNIFTAIYGANFYPFHTGCKHSSVIGGHSSPNGHMSCICCHVLTGSVRCTWISFIFFYYLLGALFQTRVLYIYP